MTPEQLKGMVFPGESGGDYDALFGFSNRAGGQFAGVRPTQMTINQVLAFTDPSGPYGQWVKGQVGRVATPVGGFQVVGSTLRDTVKRMGLTGDEMFSPAVQDAIGMNIYQNQGPGAWEGWGKGGGGGGSGSASSGSNSGGGTMPMGLFDMQEQPPQTFGERLRAGMRSGSLIDSLALAANSLRDRPDQNIAQIVQGRQERRDEKATTNRTAAWLASQGRDDLAQAMLAGGLDARTAVATAMTPAPQAEVREVGGKLVSVNPDGTVNELYAPEAQPEFRTLTADEATAMGLAPGAYQIGADGKISTIGGGGTTINMPGGGGEFEEAFAKLDAASLDSVSVAGMSAQRNIGRIDQLGEALASSPSGAEGALKLAAGEFGINTEGLDNLQTAQALINSLVPEQRAPGSGPMSDSDLALFKQSLPRIINQPGGNAAIIQTMRAIAEYDAAGADIVQLLRSGEIDRSEAFKRLRSRPNPLEGLRVPAGDDTAGGATTTAPAGGVRTFNPATGKLE
jgi:hypothetical protein